MKKLLTFVLFFYSVFGFTQAITVDQNTYTVPQLVNNVLINSPCVTAQNITWRTGSNFGSSNGIGYFSNTNSNFPMSSGVVLSTGSALEVAGPNSTLLESGNSAWIGDSDLEATLAASGITMNSTNATVLEFEFTPLSPYFNFDFLFASEEYGNFQCQFSDAFAFLLTDLNTGVTTNLAVVPNTNLPISVVTIRDYLYNSTCPSVNAQYFGRYNGGNNAATAPVNFNGQTTLMTVTSSLNTSHTYKIKLVIADRGDYKSDSAIFIASESFNIGQDVLGPNLTVADHTAICSGQNTTITSGLNPALYSFVWKKNGVVLNGETASNLVVTTPGTYELIYTNIAFPCQQVSDSKVVEFYTAYNVANPTNLYKCNGGPGPYTYNFNYNTNLIKANQPPATTVSYFTNQVDATNNVNPLPLSYNSNGNETIFVRVVNPNTGCFVIKSFQLLLTAPPVANPVSDVHVCVTPQGNATVNLYYTSQFEALGNQNPAVYSVLFYKTMADAINNVNGNGIINTTGGALYVRVFLKTDPSCYAINTFNVIFVTSPPVDDLEDVLTCEDYVLPPLVNGQYFTSPGGTGVQLLPGDILTETTTLFIYNVNPTPPSCPSETSFTVTIIKPTENNNQPTNVCNSFTIPQSNVGEYHTEPNGGGMVLPAGTIITTSQTIYYHYVSPNPPYCVIDKPQVINIYTINNVPTLTDIFDCTSYTLPPLSFGNYFTESSGGGTLLAAGTVITSTQRIYIYASNPSCSSESSFNVVIGMNFPISRTECVSFTLPPLEAGNYYTGPMGTGTQLAAGTVINTTQTIYVYAVSNSLPNCTDNYNFTITVNLPPLTAPTDTVACNAYELPQIPYGNYFTGAGGTGDIMFAGDLVTTSKTMYIYLNGEGGCINEISFQITVNQTPIVDSRSDIDACHAYVLTNLEHGDYYTGPGGTGTLLHGGDVIHTTQMLYIFANNNGCTNETSFTVNIFTINADVVPNTQVCDSFTLPALTGNNKYFTVSGGPTAGGQELLPGSVITTTQTIYIFVESGGRINCTNESSFTVTVIPTPVIAPIANVFACNSYTLPVLALGNYYTAPNKGGSLLHAGDVISTNQTLYVYSETGGSPNCFDQKSFSISIYNVPQLADVTTCSSYTLPTLTTGHYFNGPNGTGGQINAGSVVTQTKTIYIFGNSGYTPNCSDETSFTVTIVPTPVANIIPLASRTFCDTDGTNDGQLNVALSQFNPIVLGAQVGPEFLVTYHASLADATTNSAAISQTTTTLVYVRVSNTLTPDCFDVKALQIVINKLPVPTPMDGIMCYNTFTNHLIQPYIINSGLSAASHTIKWYNEQGQQVGTGTYYTAVAPGVYSVIATNNATGCASDEVFVTVTPSEPAIVAYTVNEDFADSQSITVETQGTGDYEYQLDNGAFQDSPTFNNVMSGFHTITVRDKNGCGLTVTNAIVVNYPHFFTPNGDGANETWNIKSLSDQEVAYIYIYDRYGKLLTRIKPSSSGWDGNYNNTQMPADDYWFIVNYKKDGEEKEFKAHFALKR
jgi:gliding motility-associated-like protein